MNCWFFHRWGKYEKPVVATHQDGGPTVVQFRWCERCNAKDARYVGVRHR